MLFNMIWRENFPKINETVINYLLIKVFLDFRFLCTGCYALEKIYSFLLVVDFSIRTPFCY